MFIGVRIVEYGRIFVKIVAIAGVLGGIPQRKCGRSTVVIFRTKTRVKLVVVPTCGHAIFFVSRHKDLRVYILSRIEQFFGINRIIDLVAYRHIGERCNKNSSGVSTNAARHFAIGATLLLHLGILLFGNIPIGMVGIGHPYRMVHIGLVNQAISL